MAVPMSNTISPRSTLKSSSQPGLTYSASSFPLPHEYSTSSAANMPPLPPLPPASSPSASGRQHSTNHNIPPSGISIECYRCHQLGHKSNECTIEMSNKTASHTESVVKCHRCGEKGHIAPVCPQKMHQRPMYGSNNGSGSHYHGVKSRICKFWLSGHCRQGENCLFSHAAIPGVNVRDPNTMLYQPYPPQYLPYYTPPAAMMYGGDPNGTITASPAAYNASSRQNYTPSTGSSSSNLSNSSTNSHNMYPPVYNPNSSVPVETVNSQRTPRQTQPGNAFPYRTPQQSMPYNPYHQTSINSKMYPNYNYPYYTVPGGYVHNGLPQYSATPQAPATMHDLHEIIANQQVSDIASNDIYENTTDELDHEEHQNQNHLIPEQLQSQSDYVVENEIMNTPMPTAEINTESIEDNNEVSNVQALNALTSELNVSTDVDGKQTNSQGTPNSSTIKSKQATKKKKKSKSNNSVSTDVGNDKQSKPNGKKKVASAEKGLRNETGENNCFLNVVIQALYHLQSFQERFRMISSHKCLGDSVKCVLCSLHQVFALLQDKKNDINCIISSDNLRNALQFASSHLNNSNASSFEKEKFSIGSMHDAAEAHDAVLWFLHESLKTESNQSCACAIHQVFGLFVGEEATCTKCSSSLPIPSYDAMILYASTIILHDSYSSKPTTPFDQLLNSCFMGDAKKCNKQCGNKDLISTRLKLKQHPLIFTLGLTWPNAQPNQSFLNNVLGCIDSAINLNKVFPSSINQDTNDTNCNLKGMLCYFGHHYMTFLYIETSKEWCSFDDTVVNVVGKTWDNVLQSCIMNHFQPLVLFYEVEESKDIDKTVNSTVNNHVSPRNNRSQKATQSAKEAPNNLLHFNIGDITMSVSKEFDLENWRLNSAVSSAVETSSSSLSVNKMKNPQDDMVTTYN